MPAVAAAGFSLLPAQTHWGVFSAISVAGAVGIWSERTRLGKELSGPMVATLVGLALSNAGAVPSSSPAVYGLVNHYLLPLAVPLLLFTADLRRMLFDTGRLLLIYCVGAAATIAATLLAFRLLPLRSLGPDSWKVAAALAARHIGGAVNYVGVAETLRVAPSAQAAGLAADNLLCAGYFAALFSLARRIPPDAPLPEGGEADGAAAAAPQAKPGIQVTEGAIALALSCVICYLGTQAAAALGVPDAGIPVITLISVALATAAPKLLQPLVAPGEGIAAILLSLFFGVVGASGDVRAVVATAPALFLFCLLQIGVHLALTLVAGRLLGFTRRDTLLASNANVGGPTTAAAMCAAKGWRSSVVPALLVGTLGYAVATFLAVALGIGVLRHM